jgi:son of sevenless-like protein
MKCWVTTPHFEVYTNDLARMKEFAASIQNSSRGAIENLAQELQSATTERVWFRYFCQCLILSHHWLLYLQLVSLSRPHTTISPKPTKPTEPQDLANALLILEGDKYTRILPATCISYFQPRSGQNYVRDALETNHTISSWIQQAVLLCDELGDRIGVLKFFILVAEVTGHPDPVQVT